MKNLQKIKLEKRIRRKIRTRAKIFGTAKRPRMAIFRSLKHISVQLIDDDKSKTIVSATDKEIKSKKANGVEIATQLGKLIGEKAIKAGVKEVVFDRSSYKYHGRVKAFADAARKAGLKL
ncbi:50S ribosomal protein L18 [Patescibacteria group bacterium]|nr:50S ribosomal protein L18 [Patescibacteria group bacterium]